MPNLINEAITAEYEASFEEDLDALLVQPVGLSVAEMNAFRGRLAESNLRMRLVKSSLARRVLSSRGLELDGLFEGPTAFIEGTDDEPGAAIAASRAVAAWRKATRKDLPAIKGGLMEGLVLDPSQATELARLPTREELHARILGQIVGPGRTLSAQFTAPGGRIAGAIESHIDKLGGAD